MSSLAVVIVTHDSREAVATTLPALLSELESGDELIVVDNASSDGTPAAVRELAPGAQVIDAGVNLGYGDGCNRGAEASSAELLCFLNPDAVPSAGWREAIAAPASDGSGWAAWQGLVTASDGEVINTSGGVVHFTGIAWAGGAGALVPGGEGWTGYGPTRAINPPEGVGEPGFVSGACLAIPRRTFLETGGYAGEFFLYHEDVDLSLRLRLRGGRLGTAMDARADHDYDFAKGPAKWRYLERNRWATVLRTYPLSLLLLVAPALAATELALLPISIAGGWFGQKLLAWADVVRWLPRLVGERRAIQRSRIAGTRSFAAALTPELASPYLGAAARSGLLRGLLGGYWGVVMRLLQAPRG